MGSLDDVHARADLAPLRRRVITRCISVQCALMDRPTPWRDHRSITRQIADLFGSLDDADERQLTAALWFCNQWLDLIPLADGAFWSDDDEDDDDA